MYNKISTSLKTLTIAIGLLSFGISNSCIATSSSTALTFHPTFNDMSRGDREKTIEILNPLLANLVDLHSHAKQAHWVIRGPGFFALHELFDKFAKEVSEFSDTVAERIEQLGGNVQATMRSACKLSTLPPYPVDSISPPEQLKALCISISFLTKILRSDINKLADTDAVTAEILTDIERSFDKHLWFLEAGLDPASIPEN